MLLLDTHAWIWFVQGNDKLQRHAVKAIEASIQSRTLHIAAISQWELAMLIDKSRIILNEPALSWIQKAIAHLHIKVAPLTAEIAVESGQLPADFHGDPADRMIVATARIHQLTVVTRDAKILSYGASNHVKVIEI
ncbi:MAG: type II toxin-antitoxin system VapC family toxin [Gammaproteobacteria bacterium]